MRERSLSCLAGVFALAFFITPSSAGAQSQNAEINGKILDPDGLALPGAMITATDRSTGYVRHAVSATNGAYVFTNMRPGTYDLHLEIQGFRTLNREGVILSSGAEITLDLKMDLATIEEVVTVTGETPVVELTSNKLGGTLSKKEIEDVPSNFRNFTALTQLVPGMTPNPATSSFEGGQVNANGNPSASNLYMVDGGYNNDDRLGAGPGAQVRMVLDVIDEYQVLANQYQAEFGGGVGALINMVTKSGTNDLRGRAYTFYRNDALNARSDFLAANQAKPDERTLQAGFGVGGPIVHDRAHFYFNYERDEENLGGFKTFPAIAQPLARDHVGYFNVNANNFFGRVDVQLNRNNSIMWRWVRETAPAVGEGFNQGIEMEDAKSNEQDLDQTHMLALTSIVNDRTSNVFRFGRINEDLRGNGPKTFFDDDLNWLGLEGRDQFTIGSRNVHPSFITGPGGDTNRTIIKTYTFDDTFSLFVPGWGGEHNFKFGGGFSLNRAEPRAAVSSGTFTFESDLPFNPANPASYPRQFDIVVGPQGQDFAVYTKDTRGYFFFQDKWRVGNRLTLNLGLRYDVQGIVPGSRNDISPRTGFAYDLLGDGKTVIRGGFGRFYEYTRIAVDLNLQQSGIRTLFPSVSVSDRTSAVLQPDVTTDSSGTPGVAVLSAAGQAQLRLLRDAILAGTTFNRNPIIDSDSRQMGYQWVWSIGVTHELARDLAVTVDYVGNASRDQLGQIDLNDPINGARPGVNGFDPQGQLIPTEARGVNYNRVLQYQSGPQFEGDYKSFQVGVIKRFSNRFSMRHAYTLQRSNYVGGSATGGTANPEARRVWFDRDPRVDYGRFGFDKRQVLSMSGTYNLWKGLNVAGILTASSGRPVNELTGQDGNGDSDRNDRPIRGVNDAVRPIVSEVDSQGRAVINGIDGPGYFEINLSVRYAVSVAKGRGFTLFWDVYNLGNRTNYNLPTGQRTSPNFLIPTSALFPRQMQLGIRFDF